jgi:hypothetical protein
MKRLNLLIPALMVAAVIASALGSTAHGTTGLGFGPPVYVDQQLAGGEPEVFADTLHGRLIYTAHEGTTHLYRDGIVSSPWGDFSFVSNYCNQVNVWTSPTPGRTGPATATSGRSALRTRQSTRASVIPT